MTGLAASFRARWFPASLALVVLANVATAIVHHRRAPETAPYRLAVRSDDSLAASIDADAGFYHRRFSQLYAIRDVLGGSVLVVPEDLGLGRPQWRMIALVELRTTEREPISDAVARVLQRRSQDEPLRLDLMRIYVARGLELPSERPLHLLATEGNRALFVVSEERLPTSQADRR